MRCDNLMIPNQNIVIIRFTPSGFALVAHMLRSSIAALILMIPTGWAHSHSFCCSRALPQMQTAWTCWQSFACIRSIHSALLLPPPNEILRVHPEHPLSVASNTCSTGHSAHSRLLGVIIPRAQELAISDSVHRSLVGVLIRGPCLEQSASLKLCVWYTFCR